MIDKLCEKIGAVGFPILVLQTVKFLTGHKGAIAFTDGIEDLGFGFGMIGGVVFLLILALLTESAIRFLFERKLLNIIKKMKSENYSRTQIVDEISKKLLYSKDLKNKVLAQFAINEEQIY